MTKMTIEIPDDDYKKVKIAAIEFGISVKDYVLEALRFRQKVLISEDGTVRILKDQTTKALNKSRKTKLKTFKTVNALMKELNS